MNTKKSNTDILRTVKEHVRKGTYTLVKHAIVRQEERGIRLPDVLHVLERGCHEKEKDTFDVKNQCWKHAIRGRTKNGIDLRIIVAFEQQMVIITIIRI